MICREIKEKTKLGIGILSICVIVLGYSFISWQQHKLNPTDTTIPNGSQFILGFTKIFSPDISGHRWIVDDVMATGLRFILGISAGIIASAIVGILIGCFKGLASFVLPMIVPFSKIPPTAMLAVYFVLFGTDLELFVAFIALGVFPSMTMAIYGAVTNDVEEKSICKIYTLGATNAETIYEVVYKQILPRILQNIQLQIGPAFVFLIAAEWMMADVGFGYRLRIQSRLLNMNVVYIYLVILGLTGYLIDLSLVKARHFFCGWFGE